MESRFLLVGLGISVSAGVIGVIPAILRLPGSDGTVALALFWLGQASGFAGVDDRVRRRIVRDNAVELYRMDLD